jgi:hypothetical protein
VPSDIALADANNVADRWFLYRGMPAVLPPRARWRHVVPRSAPALAAYATVVTALLVVYLLIGTSEVYIDGPPTPVERVVLTVIALAVPLAALSAGCCQGCTAVAPRPRSPPRRWPSRRWPASYKGAGPIS